MKTYLLALVAINLLGFLYGLVYYIEQLHSTNPLLWLFTIDCPLYSLLVAVVFGYAVVRKSTAKRSVFRSAFEFIVAVGAVKYGLWTLFVLSFYGNFFFSPELYSQSAILFVSHVGLLLEGLAIVGTSRIDKRVLAVAIVWFLINDYLDYFVGIHPYVPEDAGRLGLVMSLTFVSSLILPLLSYAAWNRRFNFFSWSGFLTKLRKELL